MVWTLGPLGSGGPGVARTRRKPSGGQYWVPVRSGRLASTTWDMPTGSGDRWPDEYERGRPGWPREAVELLGLPPAATVLDLGAGTGKLTRLLVSAVGRVVAVEPADAMRRVLATLCPQAEARPGDAQAIPLPDRSVDAVFAAEAFHWFDDDQSLVEIARVLRAGGALVLLWNLPGGPWEPSVTAVEALLHERLPKGATDYDPLDLGGPRRADGKWRGSFAATGFEPVRHTRTPNPQTLDRDGLVAFFASMGWIADLADEKRVPLLAEVRSLLTDSEYRRQWTTHVYWTRLLGH
jgi:SAM-dependent methyltransferase